VSFTPAARLANVQPSATLALAQRARELRAAGHDVVGLTAGEPDFLPAPHVIRAAHDAMTQGLARYTAVSGLPELRDAIAKRHHAIDGIPWAQDEIVVTTGAKQAIANALGAILDPDDEVVIVAPYWLSYADMTFLFGGKPVIVPTAASDGFAPRPEALEAAIGARTKVLILNSPSNPAGIIYDAPTLTAIAGVLRRHPHVFVLLDDIYRRLTFGGRGPALSLLAVSPDLVPRAIVIDGCSKTYAMTGYRLGWSAAPKAVSSAMAKVQGQTTSSAPATSQYAALAALTGDQGWVDAMVKTYEQRKDVVMAGLRKIDRIQCVEPGGAFYAFPDMSAWIGKKLPNGTPITDASVLVEHLLVAHDVATVPGGPFGMQNHLRLSFTTDIASLEKAIGRMKVAFDAL